MKIWTYITIIITLISLSCDKKSTQPSEITNDPNLEQTGVDNKCDDHEDCWCRIFTGAEFLPGKAPSHCCLEKEENYCEQLNRCRLCLYM